MFHEIGEDFKRLRTQCDFFNTAVQETTLQIQGEIAETVLARETFAEIRFSRAQPGPFSDSTLRARILPTQRSVLR